MSDYLFIKYLPMFKIKNHNDLYSGTTFFIISIIFLIGSLTYPLGTSSDMGPGYFPTMFSLGLLAVSLAIILGAIGWK